VLMLTIVRHRHSFFLLKKQRWIFVTSHILLSCGLLKTIELVHSWQEACLLLLLTSIVPSLSLVFFLQWMSIVYVFIVHLNIWNK
jgi:hypothetical protein